MAKASTAAPSASGFVLTVHNERPLGVADLAELLSALSRDYRQINRGRNLVVTRIETGTIHISITDYLIASIPILAGSARYIADSIEIARAGKAIFEFVQSIRNSIEKKRRDRSSGSKDRPWRTLEAMAKVAARNQCNLDLVYSSSDGEKVEARLTHTEAVKIRRKTRDATKSSDGVPEKIETEIVVASDVKLIADQIERQGPASLVESHPLIVAVVRLLRQTGNENLVEMLARELESRGLSTWAKEVRKVSRHG